MDLRCKRSLPLPKDLANSSFLTKRSKGNTIRRLDRENNDSNTHIISMNVGDIVFARLSHRAPWWPAFMIDPRMCGYEISEKAWVYWIGDDRISDVDLSDVRLLADGFLHCFRVGGTQNYICAVQKAVELYAERIGASYNNDSLDWATKRFRVSRNAGKSTRLTKPKMNYLDDLSFAKTNFGRTLLPNFVIDRLDGIRAQHVKVHSINERSLRNETILEEKVEISSEKGKSEELIEDSMVNESSFDDSSVSYRENENSGHNSISLSSSSDEVFELDQNSSDANSNLFTLPKLAVPDPTTKSYCVACGADDEKLKADHPLIEGKLCSGCLDSYMETCFVYDPDGKKEHCSICASGGDLVICDNSNCANVFCKDCISAYDSPASLLTIMKTDPWHCYICCRKSTGRVVPRSDWEQRLFLLFKTATSSDDINLSFMPVTKQPVRVLSLFDGLATAKVVLDQLGIEIGAYYSCEIDEDAILVSRTNHSNSVSYLGDVRSVNFDILLKIEPIDLIIGGSPCNDFSIANPKRKGLYDPSGTGILFFEFYRILQSVMLINNRKNRNTFWLFENVASMRMEYRSVIDRFLGRCPALYDSCHFSAQNRARYFWGNIPGMYSFNVADFSTSSPSVNDILIKDCGRVGKVDKVRTVTTRTNSLKQGRKFSVYPVEMNGKPDTLWPTELENLFGLPKHYTDVGSLSPAKRQKLIGQGWTVPVIKHILRPLKRFFRANDAL